MIYTRETLIHLKLNGDKDTVKCLMCGEFAIIPFPFITTVRVRNYKGNMVNAKSRIEFVKHFLDVHAVRHNLQDNLTRGQIFDVKTLGKRGKSNGSKFDSQL